MPHAHAMLRYSRSKQRLLIIDTNGPNDLPSLVPKQAQTVHKPTAYLFRLKA